MWKGRAHDAIMGATRPGYCRPRPVSTRSARVACALENPAPSHIYVGMLNRRRFLLASGVALAAPALARAQTAAIAAAVADLPQLHSIQVARGPETLYADAPRGPGLNALANIKSCSKSVVALLLGAALDRGEVPSVDAPLSAVAPRLLPPDATEGAGDITLEDLVTLRAGLERTSGANYGAWVASRNWVADALRRPMVAQPGGRMLYSTGSTHVLGAALAEATGLSLRDQAQQRLGAPLGIDIPGWTRDPQGYYLGGNQMALRPTAMLKLAMLMRDGGRYGGEQVIARDWIAASTVIRARSPWSGMGYGYGWFITGSGYALARGYGGQVIAAHPDRGLAVAITSDPTRPARSGGYFGELMALLDGPILALG